MLFFHVVCHLYWKKQVGGGNRSIVFYTDVCADCDWDEDEDEQ